jgi:pyruvate dehydrogenase E2 component (dihydrolipoamide acetyltransferase)
LFADVAEQASSRPSAVAPSSSGAYEDIPNSNIRKVTAQRLTLSKQTIPHYYLTIECNVDALLK